MRLTAREIGEIRQGAADIFGPDAVVRLFGSRLDDRKRGGDIDLLVECAAERAHEENRFRFWDRLQDRLGEQRIDIVVQGRGAPEHPFAPSARSAGVALTGPPPEARSDEREETRPMALTLRTALASADRLAIRLTRRIDALAPYLPLTGDTLTDLPDEAVMRFDAAVTPWVTLQDMLNRQVFPRLVTAALEPDVPRTPRDVANLMERYGVLAGAEDWRRVTEARNALVHEYPLAPAEQARRLTAMAALAPVLLAATRAADRFARQAGLLSDDRSQG